MTFAEVKIAALKLMFASYDYLVAENIKDYESDSNLNAYLYQMNESINRCFDRFLSDKAAPQAIVDFDDEEYEITEDDYFYYMDLTQITDLYRLERVMYITNGVIDISVDNLVQANVLVLPIKTGDYKLVYTKKMPYITDDTEDSDEVDLPDEIVRLIPYFIKSELYEEDEPNLATVARSIFETGLIRVRVQNGNYQANIRDIFGGYYD